LIILLLVLFLLYAVFSFIATHPWILFFPLAAVGAFIYWRVKWHIRQTAQTQQRLQAQAQRQEAEEQQRLLFAQNIDSLLSLTPRDFELIVGSLLQAQGYQQVRHSGGSGDLAADLQAFSPQGDFVVVQCKRYALDKRIGTPDIQKFIGMMTVHHRAQRGIFVTTSSFTAPAQALARQHSLELIDGRQLTALFAQVNRASSSP
jgi:restriction endonuclease Mrr